MEQNCYLCHVDTTVVLLNYEVQTTESGINRCRMLSSQKRRKSRDMVFADYGETLPCPIAWFKGSSSFD